MAIHPVFSTFLTRALLASIALLTVSCGQIPPVGVSSADASEPLVASTGQMKGQVLETEGKARPKGVSTYHDIYHSKALEVPAGKPVPAIAIDVTPDEVSGWNLYVDTANFNFTPSEVNGESSYDGGHGDLYINDKPVERIYGHWTHLPSLPPGKNEIRVTLNANSHQTLTTQGNPIEDIVTVEVYAPEATAP